MTELSPGLRELVRAGKFATQPSEADRERVYRSLEARLGLIGGATGATVTGFGGDRLRRVSLKVVSFVSAGAILIVGTGVLLHSAFQRVDSGPRAPVVTTAVQPVDEPKANLDPETQAKTQADLQVPPESTPAPTTRATEPAKNVVPRASTRPHDSLAEEVAIMTRAQKELHAGRAPSALQLLNEHERRFKNGLLAEERTAARIQVLCALGRESEANALLGRLSPKSLHGDPARQACGATKKPSATK